MTKREKRWWETTGFWKEIEKQDRLLKKLNRIIDKKLWKDFQELIGKSKSKRSDWL